ncbi:MAG TPA: hypothetical protein VHB73_05925, partial [Alphaproteobacteria bacterium]|nr:hypothetical protein [Alphaproteobacteria bacterium]
MNLKGFSPVLLVLLAALFPHPAHAVRFLSGGDVQTYRDAFAALADKRGADAQNLAARASDPLLNEV